MKYNNNFPPLFVSFIENPAGVVNTRISQNKDLAKLIETQMVYMSRSWAVRTVSRADTLVWGGRHLYSTILLLSFQSTSNYNTGNTVNLKHNTVSIEYQHWQHCQYETLTFSTSNTNTVNTFNIK